MMTGLKMGACKPPEAAGFPGGTASAVREPLTTDLNAR